MANYSLKKILILGLIFFIHQLYFQGFLPGTNGLWGADFLIAGSTYTQGKIWFAKNFLDVPWFSPAQCCGDLFYPNVQVGYYSLMQLLFILTDPESAIKIHFFIYSLLSMTGGYLLFNKSFNLSNSVSLLGASLILLNNFFNYRYIAGHTAFASFNLIALYAYLIIEASKFKLKNINSLFFISLSGLLFASTIHHGHTLSAPLMIISLFAILLIYSIKFDDNKVYLSLGLSLLSGIALSISKIYVGLKLLKLYPREYISSEFTNIGDFFYLFFKTLFLSPDISDEQLIVQENTSKVLLHEFEYSLSIVPLIIVFLFFILRNKLNFFNTKNQIICTLILLTGFFFTIIVQNIPMIGDYIPIIKSYWLRIRLNSLYIFPLIVISCVALEKIDTKKFNKNYLIFFLISILFLQNFIKDKNFYINGYSNLKTFDVRNYNTNIKDFKIDKTLSIIDTETKRVRTDIMVMRFFLLGGSLINCENALWGYDLEKLKHKEKIKFYLDVKEYEDKENTILKNTPFDIIEGKYFNFFNPACIIYPEENNCGSLPFFKTSQKKELEKFLKYEKYNFKISKAQTFLNYLSLFSLISVLVIFLIKFLSMIKYIRNYR